MAVAALLALAWIVGHAQVGQFGPITKWKVVDYYPQGNPGEGPINRLKTLLSGETALPQKNATFLVNGMRLENLKQDGSTNLVATAPECLADPDHYSVSSTGPMMMTTANGQLSIRGRGFFCNYSNVVLVISNEVDTTIQRSMIRTSPSSATRLVSAPPPGEADGSGVGSNGVMRIFSDRFQFIQQSNVVLYAGNVRVEDPQMGITCARLAVLLTTNGSVDRIVAEQDVVLRAAQSPGLASGDRAVYRLSDLEESIDLIGNPARWEDGLRSGQGDHFVFEPGRNRLMAMGPSTVRVPRSDLIQPDFGGTNAPPTNPEEALKEQVDITARFMAFELPTTNRLHRTMLASNEVVIVSAADQSRATGERADYSDATGVFELSGSARWQSGERMIRGDTLRFDRTNEVFNALNNAFLRLPLSALGDSMAMTQWLDTTNTAADTPQFVEVRCRDIDYKAGRIQFRDEVAVNLLGREVLLGTMRSALLTLSTNLEGRRIVAEGGVRFVQVPTVMSNGATMDKQLDCELATVNVGTNGLIRTMIAETNVLFRQTERYADVELPTQTELTSEIITATFAPHTNQVDSVIAERNVVISQNSGGAKGDRAVYDRAKDSLLLTGDVTLESPRGILSAPAAILRHFGLWPGKLNRIQLPAGGSRSRPNPGQADGPAPKG